MRQRYPIQLLKTAAIPHNFNQDYRNHFRNTFLDTLLFKLQIPPNVFEQKVFEYARPLFSPSPRGTGSTAGVQHLSQTSTDKSADLLPCTISGCFDSDTLIHTETF